MKFAVNTASSPMPSTPAAGVRVTLCTNVSCDVDGEGSDKNAMENQTAAMVRDSGSLHALRGSTAVQEPLVERGDLSLALCKQHKRCYHVLL